MKIIIYIAELFIKFLKSFNPEYAELIQEEVNRNKEFDRELNKRYQERTDLLEEISAVEGIIHLLNKQLTDLEFEAGRIGIKRDEQIRKNKEILGGLPDDDVIRLDLPSPSNG